MDVDEALDDLISLDDSLIGMPEGWTDQKSEDRFDHAIDKYIDAYNAGDRSEEDDE